MRRTIIIGVILLLITTALLYYFLLYDKSRSSTPPFGAIPPSASFVLAVRDLGAVSSKLKDASYSSAIQRLGISKDLVMKSQYLSELASNSEGYSGTMLNDNFLIAVLHAGSDKVDFLFIYSLPNTGKQKKIISTFIGKLDESLYTVTDRTYENQDIFVIQKKDDPEKFYCSSLNGLFIGSFTDFLVEDAISTIINGDDNSWETVTMPNEGFDASLYINYQNVPFFLSTFTSTSVREKATQLKEFASLTSFDILIKDREIMFSGNTTFPDSGSSFMSLLNEQNPQKCDLIKILPRSTALMIWTGFPDKKLLYERFYEGEALYQTALGTYILPWLGAESAVVFTELFSKNILSHGMVVLEIQDTALAFQKLSEISDTVSTKYLSKEIFKIGGNDFASKMSEAIAAVVPGLFPKFDQPLYFFEDSYVIFADDESLLRQFIQTKEREQHLGKRLDFMQFAEKISDASNLYIYASIPNCFDLLSENLSDSSRESLPDLYSYIKKFNHLVFQSSNHKGQIYSNALFSFEPDLRERTHLVKKITLTNRIVVAPSVVINSAQGKYEIMVQDNRNNIILVNRVGGVLWELEIDQRMMGGVHQIDYHKNNDMQFLFNTRDFIYLIDRDGKHMDGFPVKLGSPASTEMMVVNYDNRRMYRYFVTGTNEKIYGYYTDGQLMPGWNPKRDAGFHDLPLQHFEERGRDYIVAVNNAGFVNIYNRKGEPKIEQVQLDTLIRNSFYFIKSTRTSKLITTDVLGRLIEITLDGERSIREFQNFSPDHVYSYVDLEGDGRFEHVVLDSNTIYVYEQDSVLKFKYEMSVEVSNDLKIVPCNPPGSCLSVVDVQGEQIYLIDSSGDLLDKFPLAGAFQGTVVKFMNDKHKNLITAKDNEILIYQLE